MSTPDPVTGPVMPPAPGKLDDEPVAVLMTGLVVFLDAALVAGKLLGWLDLTPEQTAGVVGFITAAGAFVGTAIHQFVYAPATVRQREGARTLGPPPEGTL